MLDTPPLPETVAALDDLRNGTPAPTPLPRFRLRPPQYHRVTLTGDWEGAWLDMLLNPGMGLLASLQTTIGICTRLHELVRDWNLSAVDGTPLPIAPEGVAQIEPALSTAIMTAWGEARDLSKRH